MALLNDSVDGLCSLVAQGKFINSNHGEVYKKRSLAGLHHHSFQVPSVGVSVMLKQVVVPALIRDE